VQREKHARQRKKSPLAPQQMSHLVTGPQQPNGQQKDRGSEHPERGDSEGRRLGKANEHGRARYRDHSQRQQEQPSGHVTP
jgi:hypothetical protein